LTTFFGEAPKRLEDDEVTGWFKEEAAENTEVLSLNTMKVEIKTHLIVLPAPISELMLACPYLPRKIWRAPYPGG
jgi:hypothetical protein